MVSGEAYFSNGFYDFFYGYDEEHMGCKTCGRYANQVCQKNEQRPDVGFRSVIDEDGETTNYDGTAIDPVTRGGAEVFLVNRAAEKSDDLASCESTNPRDVFKKSPDSFGFGNKILFKDSVYKNITGAWRLSECYNCYGTETYVDNKLVTCSESGNYSKQNIHVGENFAQFYDPAKIVCSDADLDTCVQNGGVPKNYGGNVVSITRDEFLVVTVTYNGGTAKIKNGDFILFDGSLKGGYYIFDVEHSSNTSFKLVGTFGDAPFSFTSGTWLLHGSLDPLTCCGGAAFGVEDTSMGELPYHVDIKKVLNNDKNKLYSNREQFVSGNPRADHRAIVTSGGVPVLTGGEVTYVGELPYYGPYYDVDTADNALRQDRRINTTFKNGTCYTKSQEVLIFPDVLVQNMPLAEYCREGNLYKQNVLPRLTIVYKPCNYNSNCDFSNGRPLTAGASGVTTLAELKSGFGGQEIVMHVNLGNAWGQKFKPTEVCGCGEDVPPGEVYYPPDVIVPPPVTFPCFPKFDLRPEQYGCLDPMWYNSVRNSLGVPYQGECEEAFYDACWVRQPYTTYGYIRNLCGKESNSRLDVLKSLGDRIPTGGYTDRTDSDVVEPMYVEFTIPADIVGSGYPTGGSDSGVKPYWGLTDEAGRLAYPYFPTKVGSTCARDCPDGYNCVSYPAVDLGSIIESGFPTTSVPFLVEIDHEDYCVGCSTNQIEDKQYYITLESLPTRFIHGGATATESLDEYDDGGFKYGFNYCKYPGTNLLPKWRINEGVEEWLLPTGCDNAYVLNTSTYEDALPNSGETCGCLGGGITVPLRRHQLAGTTMPKYLSTDGGVNSYVALPSGCSEPRDTTDDIMRNYAIYFAAFAHCGNLENVVESTDESNNRYYGSLSTLYGCGACSHSYPATNSKPNLSMDFWYVRRGYETWFEGFTDAELTNGEIVYFLNAGATFTFLGPWADESGTGEAHEYPIQISTLSQGACGAGEKDVMGDCVTNPVGDVCTYGDTEFELASNYGTATCTDYRGGDRTIKLETSVPGCDGSEIKLYGYSYFNSPSPSMGTDGGFNRGTPNTTGSPAGTGEICCTVGCYLGENAVVDYSNYIPHFMSNDATGTCWDCGDYKLACLGSCGALEAASSCYGRTEENCCRIDPVLFDENGSLVNAPRWAYHCYAKGSESADLIGTFTWRPETAGGCPAGYYGSLTASHAEMFFTRGGTSLGLDQSYITAWDGTNIPGVGNVSGAAVEEPIARRVSGAASLVTHGNVGVSTCAFDSSVNKLTDVGVEFSIPTRMKEKFGFAEQTIHLGPVACEKNLAGNVVPATAVRPIYPNTIGGLSESSLTVKVNKKTTSPEIMTVHRIECIGDGYALHVSREFYEHDRVAYATEKYSYGVPPTFVVNKYPIYGKLDGGRQGVLYEHPYTGNPNPQANLYFDICDTGNLPSPSRVIETLDYPIIIPMMAQSDYISPCYPDYSGTCVYGDESFFKSTCISYYDPDSFGEGNGSGASGHLSTDLSGNLSFILSAGGSGYYTCSDPSGVTECQGCARAIFDNPCVTLNLSVAESGSGGREWFVSSGTIDYSSCGVTSCADCCEGLYGGISPTEPQYSDCLAACLVDENSCGPTTFPPSTTYPISIISCDVEPELLCAGLTTQTCDDESPIYPNFYHGGSGEALYNFYNLVYDEGVVDARFLTDSSIADGVYYASAQPGDRPEPFPKNERSAAGSIKTGFVNGDIITNESPLAASGTDFTCTYSCLQDAVLAGGDFFNNKEFFPRRKYASGTKVTRYGALSICAQNSERSWGNWLSGHVDLTSSTIDTMELGGFDEIKYAKFVDPSKSGGYTTLLSDVDREDDIIYVDDVTPLLGAKHPFFKLLNPQSLDSKSCIMPDSGCFNFLPTHNKGTSKGMEEERFFSGQDVYWTDRATIRAAIAANLVGTSGCLLDPFKIMVDVEPCNERLSHPGTSYPMNLSWVVNNIPAGVCKGWLYQPSDTCGGGCDKRIGAFGINGVFGPSTIVKVYTCAGGYLEDSFCSFEEISEGDCNSAPETIGTCPEVIVKEYFVWTGRDGVEYIYLDYTPYTYKASHDHRDTTGHLTDMSCYKFQRLGTDELDICGNKTLHREPAACTNPPFPFCDELGEGVIPDTSGPDQNCVEPIDVWYGPQVSMDLASYLVDNYEDGIFCKVIRGSTNFEIWKAAVDANGCPNGAVRGYRDFVLLGEPCELKTFINREYQCYEPDSIIECPFPSVIKVTITE